MKIHNDLITINESECPFCYKQLVKGNVMTNFCCDNPEIGDVDGILVCHDCGLVHSCISKSEYIDFFENMYCILRKSVYIRKYHVENTLNDLLVNHKINVTQIRRNQIHKIFKEIGYILPQINENRKRMISTKYIIMKILEMMSLSYYIPITKSKQTLAFYNKYWSQIMTLIGDKIESIIVK